MFLHVYMYKGFVPDTMIFPSRSFRQILFLTKAAQLTVRSFSSDSASIFCFHSPISFTKTRNNRCITRIPSIPVIFLGASCLFTITTRFVGISRQLSTQASSDEEEIALSEILAALENAPSSAPKLCAAHIQKLCRDGDLYAAERLLRSLREKQFPIPASATNALLAAACEKNDIELESRVFTDAIASSESLPSATYLCIANAFAKADDCTRLLKFVEDVTELTFPSTKTLNRILSAFGETRQVDRALMIFDHIKSLNWEPDLVTHNILLEILGSSGRVDEMLREFGSIKGSGVIFPDVVSYNTLLNGLRKVGRVDLCALYYKEMGDNGIRPDLLTYTAMIESFGRSGNVEEATRLFDEMKSKQIQPSVYIYRSLVNNLKKMGKLELAMKLLEEMKSCTASELAGPMDFKRNKRYALDPAF